MQQTERKLFIDNDRMFVEVQAYTGKYAVQNPDFFRCVAADQSGKMENSWKYRPINAEIEITNKCNQHCPHCGMASNGMNGSSYSSQELMKIAESFYRNGITSVSITGGEPFIEFDRMTDFISACKGKVDICKITTNGFWGNRAGQYFQRLEKAGLFCNRYFVPCFMISIGEQTTPIEDSCAILHYAIENYTSKEITLCISSMSEFGGVSRTGKLIEIYRALYGDFPENRVFLTENYYRNAEKMENAAKPVTGRKVVDYMHTPVKCFEHMIGRYVHPRMLIKADGQVQTCACFNPPKELIMGNIREMELREILKRINQNVFVSIIAENGLQQFSRYLPESLYSDLFCENECDACRILISLYKARNGMD